MIGSSWEAKACLTDHLLADTMGETDQTSGKHTCRDVTVLFQSKT